MVTSDRALYSVPRGFPSPLRLDFSSHNHYLDSNNCSGIGDDTRESDNVNHLTRSFSGADIETSVFLVAQDEDEDTVEPIRLNAMLGQEEDFDRSDYVEQDSRKSTVGQH